MNATSPGKRSARAEPAARNGRAVQFGDYCLLPHEAKLLRRGDEVHLEPKAWAVLDLLVHRCGTLVSKRDLLEHAWPGVVASDAALSQTIVRLRAALRDNPRSPRFIATVPRRGYRFVAELREPGRDEAAIAPPRVRCVGREADLRVLDKQAAQASARVRRMVFVRGEIGMGKTTLLESFRQSLADDWWVANGQCIEHYGPGEPYLPILDAFEQFYRGADSVRLRAQLVRRAPSLLQQMPWLLDEREGLAMRNEVVVGTRPRVLREMAAALEALSNARPVVLILEDLHWSDPATLDFLNFLARRRSGARLMVVGSYRPSHASASNHPIEPAVRDLERRALARSINLRPLGRDAAEQAVADRFAGAAIPRRTIDWIFERTEGHPLFVSAVCDQLEESGAIARRGGAWHVDREIDLGAVGTAPRGLGDVVDSQLSAMTEGDQSILEAASVVGMTFAAATVAHAIGRSAISLEDVEAACDRISRESNLLVVAPERVWDDGTRTSAYRFRHVLYRTVLYDRLSATQRRRLHRRAGKRLEEAGRRESHSASAELALHFERGGDERRAVHYLVQASRHARSLFAEREAETYLASALPHIQRLAAGPETDLLEVGVRTNLSLTRLLRTTVDAELELSMERVAELLAAAPDDPSIFPFLRATWRVGFVRSRPELAAEIARRMASVAAISGRADYEVEAESATALARLMGGALQDATCALARAAARYDELDRADGERARSPRLRWCEVGAQIHTFLGWTLALGGDFTAARDAWQRCRGIIESGPVHPFTICGAEFTIAANEGSIGNTESAAAACERALKMAHDHEFRGLHDALLVQRGWIDALAEGATSISRPTRAAWNRIDPVEQTAPHPLTALYFAELCASPRAAREGLALVELLRRDCDGRALHWYDPAIAHAEAVLRLEAPRTAGLADARRSLSLAVDIAERQGAWTLALRSAVQWNRIARDTPSRRALAKARGRIRAAPTPALIVEADRLLREAASSA